MKRPFSWLLLALAASLAIATGGRTVAPEARADGGFRCPSGRLVSTGDHMSTVRKKCGDPAFTVQRTEKRKIKVKVRRWLSPSEHEDVSEEREIEVLVDEWTYDFGAERFIRYVLFEDARVTAVTTGEYGSRS
jgi:hypothetical protein